MKLKFTTNQRKEGLSFYTTQENFREKLEDHSELFHEFEVEYTKINNTIIPKYVF
tara:strand:+ start:664 stop:828 length:165 start_codon:yes stop_codon:yes gene_type:complete